MFVSLAMVSGTSVSLLWPSIRWVSFVSLVIGSETTVIWFFQRSNMVRFVSLVMLSGIWVRLLLSR